MTTPALRTLPFPAPRWWRARQAARAAAERDASALIDQFAGRAYDEARTRALDARSGRVIDNRPSGHWDLVRAIIARRTGRHRRPDTATRYIEEG